MRKLLGFLTLCLIVAGAAGIWHVYNGYLEGQQEYTEMQDLYVSTGDSKEGLQEQGVANASSKIEETEVISLSEDDDILPDDAPTPSIIDFAGLKRRNEDIIAWIEIPAIQVSYPVLHATDNEYYLHRDADQNDLFAGSIFLDCNNHPDFSDLNSIVYGHNMRDGTMFARLADLQRETILEESPYFWIYTEKQNCLYRMISIKRTSNESSCYQILLEGAPDYMNWVLEMINTSEVNCNIPADIPELRGTVVTLSTCTESSLSKQVVQGIKIASTSNESVKNAITS